MDSIDSSLEPQIPKNTIEDLPDEVIEFILGFLPPYKDLQDCMCVCRRWYICANNVMRKASTNLQKAVSEFNIRWRNMTPAEMAPSISKRFSHAACVHESSMYVFGGCTTNSTAFNDLWRFDLSKRQWIRPLAMGTYPAPKAYASMIRYENTLILFGGWTYPSRSSFYQEWKIFNEIHFYNIKKNRWIQMNTVDSPPPTAGHSAMIHNNCMIVFGGLFKPSTNPQIQCSNDIWVLDLKLMIWTKQPTSSPKPQPRYGQSLIDLKNNSFMILGGVKAFQTRFVFNDCWILIMEGPIWTWREVTMKNKEWSASNIWCNPACKVGDKVVSLSHTQNGIRHPVTSAVRIAVRDRDHPPSLSFRIEQSARRPVDHDQNVNGKRGALPHRRTNNVVESRNRLLSTDDEIDQSPGPSNMDRKLCSDSKENKDNVLDPASDLDSLGNNIPADKIVLQTDHKPTENNTNKDQSKSRIPTPPHKAKGLKIVRRLNNANGFRMAAFQGVAQDIPQEIEVVNRIVNRVVNRPQDRPQENRVAQDIPPVCQPIAKKKRRNTLSLHVLDISNIMRDTSCTNVSWLCPRQREISGAPEELVMYTLVRGKGELVMFGGVHNDVTFLQNYTSSHLYSNSLYFIIPPRDII